MTAAPENPLLAKCYIPNPAFEQQVINAWKMAQAGAGAAGQPFTAPEDETVITFNPKELILLEKAFDNLLTATDLKADAVKYSESDAIKCQRIIKRSNDEFVMIDPSKKRRKKRTDKPKVDGVVKEKAEAKPKATPKSPTKKPASAKKSKAAKAEEAKKPEKKVKEEDSDDEPIRKLKEASPSKATKVAGKSAEKSPTRASRRSSKSATPKEKKTPKAKTPKAEEGSSKKRGRPSGSKNKEKEDEKRSASKPKKEETASKKTRKSKAKK
jgi:hypothetical protein